MRRHYSYLRRSQRTHTDGKELIRQRKEIAALRMKEGRCLMCNWHPDEEIEKAWPPCMGGAVPDSCLRVYPREAEDG